MNITPPMPTKPTINSGDILLCTPQNITASATNATNYEWSTTGGITASSPGGTSTAYITGTSDGTLKVRSYSSVCAASTITLLSESSGKQVKSINTMQEYSNSDFKGSKKIEVDVRDLPRGIYYLHISTKSESNNVKILLQ